MSEYNLPQENLDITGADNYQPSEDEKKAVDLGRKLLESAKKFKCKYDEKWQDYYNMFRGRQWKELRPSYRHSEVINLVFRAIQSDVPIMTDSRPKFEYLPQEPGDIEIAAILNQLAEADWNKYNWLEQETESLYDSHILGTGLCYMGWDQSLEQGIGAPCFESKDPFYIFPDAYATDVNKKCNSFIEVEPMPLEEIKKKWPKNGKYVSADVYDLKKMEIFDKSRIDFRSPDLLSSTQYSSNAYSDQEKPQALVVTVYVDSTFEINEEKIEAPLDDGTIDVKFVSKKKYPRGRKFIYAGEVLLEDGENPYEDGKIPYARVQNYVNQRQFWGISEVEQLESPQKIFNKLVSFSLDVLTLMGNPVWVVGTGSGVDTENLINQPGLIIEAENPELVKRQEGVQLQPFVLQLIDRMKLWFDDVSGSNDSSRGIRPEGVTAASAITALQEASQTRIRQKARNLDYFLQNIGQMYLARVMQYYTAPRVFRITGKDGAMKFFKFHVETMQDGSKVVRHREFKEGEVVDPVTGIKTGAKKLYEGEEKVLAFNGNLDVRITTGSALPFAKEENENKTFQLFDRQIIDAEEVLKSIDYPNREAVLNRMQQKMAEQQAQSPQGASAQG